MKIRLKTVMAGPEGVFSPGTVIEVTGEEAQALLSAGYADPVEFTPETAAIDPGMRAVRPASRPRKIE